MNSPPDSLSYKDAGVDIDAGNALVRAIKPLVERTRRDGCLGGIGGFGGFFEIPKGYKEPVLVSGTDGVGTKLKLAQMLNCHNTIGIDLVAMCVNDILVSGAESLFFLDYFATGKLDTTVAEQVVAGIAAGCEQAGCALIGGETAEMPDMYAPGDYDLAGFCVGVVEKSKIIDGSKVSSGDIVLGLASSGLHSNGFSLVRKVIETSQTSLGQKFGEHTLGDELLKPTCIYVQPILKLIAQTHIKGMAHITGGGLPENIVRMLPEKTCIRLQRSNWPQPEIFSWLQTNGRIEDNELLRTFNCGIGMALILAEQDVDIAVRVLEGAGESVYQIGTVETKQDNQDSVIIDR